MTTPSTQPAATTADVHPSGKPWISRAELRQLTPGQLAERADELAEAAAEGRIRNQ